MNELHLIYFTKTGESTASRIAGLLSDNPDWAIRTIKGSPLTELTASIFQRNNTLVFIGAIGIAVRAVAPLIGSKMSDPPVIVVDDEGSYVIPILSGHVGGANQIARKIAAQIGAIPVITTATDVCGVFAADVFAVENGYTISDPEAIKAVSARLLENKPVGLSCEYAIEGPLPQNVVAQASGSVGIHIGESKKSPFQVTLHLLPKCYHVGLGTKRGIAFDLLHEFFMETLNRLTIPIKAVGSVSSIDLKRDEEAIKRLTLQYRIPFRTYATAELQRYEWEFASSEFVLASTGVGNVCETSARLASNEGAIILGKTVRSGMTLAIAKENWKVRFPVTKEVNP